MAVKAGSNLSAAPNTVSNPGAGTHFQNPVAAAVHLLSDARLPNARDVRTWATAAAAEAASRFDTAVRADKSICMRVVSHTHTHTNVHMLMELIPVPHVFTVTQGHEAVDEVQQLLFECRAENRVLYSRLLEMEDLRSTSAS